MVGAPRCPSVGASRQPDVARRLLVRQLKPATRLLPDVCPRAGTVERALLAVTAGVRAPLLSLTGRARFARRPPPVAAPREALVLGGRRPRCARPDTAKPSPGGRPPVRGEPLGRDRLLAPDLFLAGSQGLLRTL